MTNTEHLKKIKEYVTALANILHPNERPLHTVVDEWPFSAAINVTNSCGDIETHSTRELKIVNKSVILVDEEYIEIPVNELDPTEIKCIYVMLYDTYMELTGTEL